MGELKIGEIKNFSELLKTIGTRAPSLQHMEFVKKLNELKNVGDGVEIEGATIASIRSRIQYSKQKGDVDNNKVFSVVKLDNNGKMAVVLRGIKNGN